MDSTDSCICIYHYIHLIACAHLSGCIRYTPKNDLSFDILNGMSFVNEETARKSSLFRCTIRAIDFVHVLSHEDNGTVDIASFSLMFLDMSKSSSLCLKFALFRKKNIYNNNDNNINNNNNNNNTRHITRAVCTFFFETKNQNKQSISNRKI